MDTLQMKLLLGAGGLMLTGAGAFVGYSVGKGHPEPCVAVAPAWPKPTAEEQVWINKFRKDNEEGMKKSRKVQREFLIP